VRVSRANHDAFRSLLKGSSSGSFDFVIIRNDPKIIDILHNLQLYEKF
jgi:hypothetical protein